MIEALQKNSTPAEISAEQQTIEQQQSLIIQLQQQVVLEKGLLRWKQNNDVVF